MIVEMFNGWPHELVKTKSWGTKVYHQLMWFKCVKCSDFIDHGCECKHE